MNAEKTREAFRRGYRSTPDGKILNPSGRELSLGLSGKGYPVFSFERGSTLYAHQFAAFCLFGEDAVDAPCVRHKNGNKLDFSAENILIGTYSENEQDKDPEVRKRSAKIAANSTQRAKNMVRADTEKVCTKCKVLKPYSCFGPCKESPDGHTYRCRMCRAAYEDARRRRLGIPSRNISRLYQS